jgi:hypothetical protein
MKIVEISKPSVMIEEKNSDPIYLFLQFYVDPSPSRANEIIHCLNMNILNPHISTIYLLNEKIYDLNSYGIKDPTNKIIQINNQKRLSYVDVFKYINDHDIKGYTIFMNSDILLDETIDKLRYTDIHLQKKMYALLRYEYNFQNINLSRIFGPRFDSQDTWILHSNFKITPEQQKVFNFDFGKPGCDNKIVYLMNFLGYEVINDPLLIKTYHYHSSQVRTYTKTDVIKQPWGLISPYNIHFTKVIPSLGIDLSLIYKDIPVYNFKNSNTILFDYITKKMSRKEHFIIPRIAGIENEYALLAHYIQEQGMTKKYEDIMKHTLEKMKNNAGIKLSSVESVIQYSKMYMESFDNCETYFNWEPYGIIYKSGSMSIEFMKNKLNKPIIWASALDIYHYIYSNPWTYALKGKRVLIISSFEKSILEKIPIREKIYGVDLFPECVILTICPPQTQGNEPSEDFSIELKRFTERLDLLEYDVALVSCGGYGNLVCNHIYKSGKSAIYVGESLQMYFGILENRWLQERPDVVRLFLNSYWSKPKQKEIHSG